MAEQVIGCHSVDQWKEKFDEGKNAKKLKRKKMAEQVIGCHSVDQWKEKFDEGKNAKKLVVIDFTASWCGPCRFIAPILADLAKKYPGVMFLKVDVDEMKNVAEEYKVDAMPTFVFLKEGEEIDRVVGARKEALVELVLKHSAETSSSAAE